MPIVSVYLSGPAYDVFRGILKGKRSRVVSDYLVSRSLDAVDPTEGVSGHELAEMVVELRSMLIDGHAQRDALRAQVRHLESKGTFTRGEEE